MYYRIFVVLILSSHLQNPDFQLQTQKELFYKMLAHLCCSKSELTHIQIRFSSSKRSNRGVLQWIFAFVLF